MSRRKTDKYDHKKSDVMDDTTELAKWVTTQLTDSDKHKLLHTLKGTLEVTQHTQTKLVCPSATAAGAQKSGEQQHQPQKSKESLMPRHHHNYSTDPC